MVSLHDVGVNEIRHETGLSDEIVLKFRYGGIFLPDQLHRDGLPELASAPLTGLVYDPHAAIGDFADHLVMNFVEDVF
jgi:hypothetical protein